MGSEGLVWVIGAVVCSL